MTRTNISQYYVRIFGQFRDLYLALQKKYSLRPSKHPTHPRMSSSTSYALLFSSVRSGHKQSVFLGITAAKNA